MDIDRISYIFGSFARRRQSQELGSSAKRRPSSSTRILHDRSKSTPHQNQKRQHHHQQQQLQGTTSATPQRARSVVAVAEDVAEDVVVADEPKFRCPVCRCTFEEPRVLPCLHTFCLRCLEELERREAAVWYDDEDGSVQRAEEGSSGSRKASSGGSGYDSSPCKGLRCPSCGSRFDVPSGGVAAFPPNYPLQNRMVLATLNSRATHLLCDLCPGDVSAASRCMDCAVTFCETCEELHLRQKASADHEVLTLDRAREKGITRIRRQVMCMRHPNTELTLFCCTCSQVVCRDCVATSHREHVWELVSKAAKSHFARLKMAADRAKAVVEESAMEASKLAAASKKFEAQCGRVQGEVEKFIGEYLRAVEEHKEGLLRQINQAKEEKLQDIAQERLKLQRRIRDARDVAYFLDDLLDEGTEVEVLSFVEPVLSKMERCEAFEGARDVKLSGSLQFLREETVKCSNGFYTLYGVITTQSVSPERCVLSTEGLQNLRVGKKVEVLLETRDHDDVPIERGGEEVSADVRHRDAGVSRSLTVHVQDKKDGTYVVSFVPDVAGKLVLSVNVKGRPVNGSPFPFAVRTVKPHAGTFHCCNFCSSGGSKEATCGCGGKMPGGYRGCGHGHDGHPGRRHWSCCGNVLEHSECVRTNAQYQFTL